MVRRKLTCVGARGCNVYRYLGNVLFSLGQLEVIFIFYFFYFGASFWISDLFCIELHLLVLYFDLRPGPKILFQGNTPEGSDTFQRPVIERDCVGGLRLMIWDKVKVSLRHYSHRKRVTSELHDSYFRLMTIKHSISKIQ